MSDFISARVRTFSKATERDRVNPPPVDGNDPRYFSHRVSRGSSERADAERAERQGSGGARNHWDERFFSDSAAPDVKPAPGYRADTSASDGYPCFSEELSSGAMLTSDRLRDRSQNSVHGVTDMFDPAISSERADYSGE